jgi:prepilin-type N-terminal cleavage/methylation domain-containing protein
MINRNTSSGKRTSGPIRKNCSGFSLIELMVAMVVGTIVLASVIGAYSALSRSYISQNVAADVQEAMRAAMDFMAEDIMMAGLDPEQSAGAQIEAATADSLHFTSDRNMNGLIDAADFEEINYFLNGRQLIQRLYSDGATDEVVIDNVNNVTFRYFDGADPPNELAPPLSDTNRRDLRSVEVSLTVAQPAGRGGMVDRTFTTRVRCRNIGI